MNTNENRDVDQPMDEAEPYRTPAEVGADTKPFPKRSLTIWFGLGVAAVMLGGMALVTYALTPGVVDYNGSRRPVREYDIIEEELVEYEAEISAEETAIAEP